MLNHVFLIGRLGGDPEMKYLPNGTEVCNFQIATTESWKKEGQKKEKTEWHRIIAWGNLAKIATEYLEKGQLVCIEGKIRYKSWEDKSGNKRTSTEIEATGLKMLGGGRGKQAGRQEEGPGPGANAQDGDDIPF